MSDPAKTDFYCTVPVLTEFSDVVDGSKYVPIPDDWIVGTSDIVSSTEAIASGQYKTVNMVGASVISAAMNAFGHREFPFVFGGDGVSLAAEASQEEALLDAMARAQAWAEDETGLSLRCAIFPVSEIRKAGHDVRVAKFQAAPSVTYAMFSGGGMAWAEEPPSRTRHFVSNIRVKTADEGAATVHSNLLLFRNRGDSAAHDLISAERHDRLRREYDDWRLAERLILVDQATLGTLNLAVFL